MPVFDTELWLPGVMPGMGRQALSGPPGAHRLPPPSGYGFANYGRVFTSGLEPETQAEPSPGDRSDLTMANYLDRADQLIAQMDAAGVTAGALITAPNEPASEIGLRFPTRILSFASFSPFDGMRAVRRLEHLVTSGGIRGLSIAPLYDQLPASDRRYYPLYAKCIELNIPVRIYASMTYANDRAYDLGHPAHIDRVAVDLPELRIMAGLGGWPWVQEMVAIARRHPNVVIDTGSHRPKYLATPGAGWDPLMALGNTVLQDRVLAGLSAPAFGMSMSEVIDEYRALPLKPHVVDKWLYRNAVTFFDLDEEVS